MMRDSYNYGSDLDKVASAKNKARDKTWYLEASKKRFSAIAETKMQTCFIGIISLFEESFGSLWGHGKKDKTETQLKNKKVWDECRQRILDHGNKQKRALQKEIDEYDLYWKRHTIKSTNLAKYDSDDEENFNR